MQGNLHVPFESVTPPAGSPPVIHSASDEPGVPAPERAGSTDSAPIPIAQASTEAGSGQGCILLGIIFLVVGFWFLVVDPSASHADILGARVGNLQLLTIGETSSIVGAIFLAAGIRPRRM